MSLGGWLRDILGVIPFVAGVPVTPRRSWDLQGFRYVDDPSTEIAAVYVKDLDAGEGERSNVNGLEVAAGEITAPGALEISAPGGVTLSGTVTGTVANFDAVYVAGTPVGAAAVDVLTAKLAVHARMPAQLTVPTSLVTDGGVTAIAGRRYLLDSLTDAAARGIYSGSASGLWTRVADFNASADIANGALILVVAGDDAGTLYQLDQLGAVLGTDALSFSQVAGGGGGGGGGTDFASAPITNCAGVENSTAGFYVDVDGGVRCLSISADGAAVGLDSLTGGTVGVGADYADIVEIGRAGKNVFTFGSLAHAGPFGATNGDNFANVGTTDEGIQLYAGATDAGIMISSATASVQLSATSIVRTVLGGTNAYVTESVSGANHQTQWFDAGSALGATLLVDNAATSLEAVGTLTLKAGGAIAWRPSGASTDSLAVAIVSSETKVTTPTGQNLRIAPGGTFIGDGTSRSMINVGGVARLDCQTSSNTLGTTATDLLLNGFSLQASIASSDVTFYCGTRKFVVSDYSANAQLAFRPVTDAASTDATKFTLFTYSPSTTRPSAYEVFVFAEDASGNMKAWYNVFPARGQGGSAAFAGGSSPIAGTVLGTADVALGSAAFEIDTSTTTIRGRATGIAATSLNWSGFVREIH